MTKDSEESTQKVQQLNKQFVQEPLTSNSENSLLPKSPSVSPNVLQEIAVTEYSKLTVLVGLGAIIVTLLMASGSWSIFDFGVATSLINFGLYFLKSQKISAVGKWEAMLFALPFAVLTTAALIAFFSVAAILVPTLARFDANTYKIIYPQDSSTPTELYKMQTFWQSITFLISLFTWFVAFYLPTLKRKVQQEQLASAAKA